MHRRPRSRSTQLRLLHKGALRWLEASLDSVGKDGPAVVIMGTNSAKDAYVNEQINKLGDQAIPVRIAGKTPQAYDLHKISEATGGCSPGCIVAIGGGRIIDLAKLFASGLSNETRVALALTSNYSIKKLIPIVAVPTTAGSGSEATPFAVIYHDGHKNSIDHPSLLPDVALIDPLLSMNAPQHVVATSGIDSMCQAVEALLNVNATTESDKFAYRALNLASKHIINAVAGSDLSRARMCGAAHLAGLAIAITRTTIPHALSYRMTEHYGIAHGQAVALSMGRYLSTFEEALIDEARFGRWAPAMQAIRKSLGADSEDLSVQWQRLLDGIGLSTSAQACGLSYSDVETIVHDINLMRMANSPLTLKAPQLHRLLW